MSTDEVVHAAACLLRGGSLAADNSNSGKRGFQGLDGMGGLVSGGPVMCARPYTRESSRGQTRRSVEDEVTPGPNNRIVGHDALLVQFLSRSSSLQAVRRQPRSGSLNRGKLLLGASGDLGSSLIAACPSFALLEKWFPKRRPGI